MGLTRSKSFEGHYSSQLKIEIEDSGFVSLAIKTKAYTYCRRVWNIFQYGWVERDPYLEFSELNLLQVVSWLKEHAPGDAAVIPASETETSENYVLLCDCGTDAILITAYYAGQLEVTLTQIGERYTPLRERIRRTWDYFRTGSDQYLDIVIRMDELPRLTRIFQNILQHASQES